MVIRYECHRDRQPPLKHIFRLFFSTSKASLPKTTVIIFQQLLLLLVTTIDDLRFFKFKDPLSIAIQNLKI